MNINKKTFALVIVAACIVIVLALGGAWYWWGRSWTKTTTTNQADQKYIQREASYAWVALSATRESDYTTKNGKVYFEDDTEFSGADSATFAFAVLATSTNGTYAYASYAKDKDKVYFIDSGECEVPSANVIANADPSTFTPIVSALSHGCSHLDSWAKDKDHAYYEGEMIPGADPATFIPLEYGYAKDRGHVYCAFSGLTVLSDADPATFVTFGYPDSGYSKDKNHVYANSCKILSGADSMTFSVLNSGNSLYAKDKNAVYYWGSKINGMDPNTLVYIGTLWNPEVALPPEQEYVKDKNHVYYGDGGYSDGSVVIAGADVATFTLVDSAGKTCGLNCKYDAQDKSSLYYRGDIVRNK